MPNQQYQIMENLLTQQFNSLSQDQKIKLLFSNQEGKKCPLCGHQKKKMVTKEAQTDLCNVQLNLAQNSANFSKKSSMYQTFGGGNPEKRFEKILKNDSGFSPENKPGESSLPAIQKDSKPGLRSAKNEEVEDETKSCLQKNKKLETAQFRQSQRQRSTQNNASSPMVSRSENAHQGTHKSSKSDTKRILKGHKKKSQPITSIAIETIGVSTISRLNSKAKPDKRSQKEKIMIEVSKASPRKGFSKSKLKFQESYNNSEEEIVEELGPKNLRNDSESRKNSQNSQKLRTLEPNPNADDSRHRSANFSDHVEEVQRKSETVLKAKSGNFMLKPVPEIFPDISPSELKNRDKSLNISRVPNEGSQNEIDDNNFFVTKGSFRTIKSSNVGAEYRKSGTVVSKTDKSNISSWRNYQVEVPTNEARMYLVHTTKKRGGKNKKKTRKENDIELQNVHRMLGEAEGPPSSSDSSSSVSDVSVSEEMNMKEKIRRLLEEEPILSANPSTKSGKQFGFKRFDTIGAKTGRGKVPSRFRCATPTHIVSTANREVNGFSSKMSRYEIFSDFFSDFLTLKVTIFPF